MFLLQVDVVILWIAGGKAAILTHVHLRPTLLVGEIKTLPVYLLLVGLQRASLRERLVTVHASVWTNACKHRRD